MSSPTSPYIAPSSTPSDKKWWDPFGLFASKPATPAPAPTTAGKRRRHHKTMKMEKGGRRKSYKAGYHHGKKHSRK